MFLLSRPDEGFVREVLARNKSEKFSYEEVAGTLGEMPAGYQVLRGRVEVGRGAAAFEAGVSALRRWTMFEVPNVWFCWPDAAVEVGTTVGVVIRHFGFWSLNVCRVVYVVDEDGPVRRFGFAYGTLPEHAERGEERFLIEWDRGSDAVFYDIVSFSRLGSWAGRVVFPAARWLQRRFIRESLRRMVSAVCGVEVCRGRK